MPRSYAPNPNALCHGGAPYGHSNYYPLPKGQDVAVGDILACWMFHGMKPGNWSGVRFEVRIDEVWPWRLFRYRGYDCDVPYWDAMKTSLKLDGWWPRNPLILMFGADGCITLEGNHKLQMARELGWTKVPARIGDFSSSYCHYPAGLQPYLIRQAAVVDQQAKWCDWPTFRRAIDRLSLERQPATQSAATWEQIVHKAIRVCKQAGSFGPQYEQSIEFTRTPRDRDSMRYYHKRERKDAFAKWQRWVRDQQWWMNLYHTAWPLKHMWPEVDMDELERDHDIMSECYGIGAKQSVILPIVQGTSGLTLEQVRALRPGKRTPARQDQIDEIMMLLTGRRS